MYQRAALFLIVFLILLSGWRENLFGQDSRQGFKDLFDGKTLTGWEGNSNYWSVKDGVIVGEITADKPLENNTFLVWSGGPVKDFELFLECRISGSGNSGINYRSEYYPGLSYALKGYQADIDGQNSYTGQNYEERGRTTLAYRGQKTVIYGPASADEQITNHIRNNAWTKVKLEKSLGASEELKSKIKKEDWNEIHLIVQGNRMKHYVNGILMSDVTDKDPYNSKSSGLIGLQVHVGPPMKVEYRNIQIKIIP